MKEITLADMLVAARFHAKRKIKQFRELMQTHGDKEIIKEYLEYWEEFETAVNRKMEEYQG